MVVIRATPFLLQRGEWAVASYRRHGIDFANGVKALARARVPNPRTFF
jgi:hypothetical protein